MLWSSSPTTQMFFSAREAHQTELRHTGVLILVHTQQIAVFVLVEIPHILVLGQQLHSLVDQVVKVECLASFRRFCRPR